MTLALGLNTLFQFTSDTLHEILGFLSDEQELKHNFWKRNLIRRNVAWTKPFGPINWVDPWILHFLPDDELNCHLILLPDDTSFHLYCTDQRCDLHTEGAYLEPRSDWVSSWFYPVSPNCFRVNTSLRLRLLSTAFRVNYSSVLM